MTPKEGSIAKRKAVGGQDAPMSSTPSGEIGCRSCDADPSNNKRGTPVAVVRPDGLPGYGPSVKSNRISLRYAGSSGRDPPAIRWITAVAPMSRRRSTVIGLVQHIQLSVSFPRPLVGETAGFSWCPWNFVSIAFSGFLENPRLVRWWSQLRIMWSCTSVSCLDHSSFNY